MRNQRWRAHFLATTAYLGCSLLVFRSVLAAPSALMPRSQDPALTAWYLAWFPWSISHGAASLVTTAYQAAPDGLNLMWQPSIPALSIVMWPVTAAVNATFAYNVVAILGLATSALAAYIAFGRFVSSTAARFIGGLLYGFNSFTLARALGHAHWTVVFFPPIALVLLDELLRVQRWRPRTIGLIAGVLASLQLLIVSEIIALTVVTASVVVAGIIIWWWRRGAPDLVAKRAYVVRAGAWAIASAFVLSAVPVGVQLFGPERPQVVLHHRTQYVTDPLNLVVPTRAQQFAPNSALRVSDRFTGNIAEQNAYVGLPLLALLLVAWRRAKNRAAANLGGAIAAVAAVLSLGPVLKVLGHRLPIPLPEAAFAVLPLLREMLAARLMLIAFLGMGLLLAAWLDGQRSPGWRRVAVAGACLVPMLPARIPVQRVDTPAFFRDGAALKAVENKRVLLLPATTYPVDDTAGAQAAVVGYPHVWQVEADFRFRMVNVLGYSLPGGVAIPPGLERLPELEAGRVSADPLTAQQLAAALCRLGVDAVIAGPPAPAAEVALVTDALGRPPTVERGVRLWLDARRDACEVPA